MKHIWFLIWLFAGCTTTSSPHSPDVESNRIDYVIEPARFNEQVCLRMTLSFQATSPKMTLVLPDKWASENDYYNDIRDLHSENAKILSTSEPHLKTIEAAQGSVVSVSYLLLSAKAHGQNPFRALVTPEYFHVVGPNLFAYPDIPTSTPVKISISWRGFADNYKFANSLGAQSRHQELKATIEDLQNSIYVGGDFRIKELSVEGRPVFTAIRGSWLFSDDDFSSKIASIVAAERAFWNDSDFPYFLVTRPETRCAILVALFP
jgi:predicted metalloprotease with PDZ domain